MDEKTHDTYVIYRNSENSDHDALYVNGEMVKSGGRSPVMLEALERLGVEFRDGTDHIHSGNFIRDLSDIRLNMRTQLRKRAQELSEEGDTIMAALHEIDGKYWGPADGDD